MAYIGNTPAEAYISISSQTFTTINGTGYTLSSSVTNSEDIALFLNNVRQKPSTYTATGTALTMGTATTTADELYCVYLGKGIQTVTPPAASVGTSSIADLAVTTAKLAGDAVTTAKILDDNVTTAKILDDNVTTAKILDANVTTPKANFISTSSGAGVISKGTSGDSDGYLQLNCSENSHGIKLKSPPHSAAQSYTLTFPQTAPATDKYLQTDASGNLSWVDVNVGDIAWQAVTTTTTLTAVAGRGYPIDTTSNACTVTLPASASVGDQIIFTDYARNWNTNAVTLNQNSLNYQGNSSPNPEYDTDGETVHIVYMDATKGWIPLYDGAVALETAQAYSVDFLVIAGGGGGGGPQSSYGGAGGGAGGYRTSVGTTGGGGSLETAASFTPAAVYTVTVGTGGAGGGSNAVGVVGLDSSLIGTGVSITSAGGGFGGSTAASDGGDGGSGGGAGIGKNPGSGTTDQGYDGGTSVGSAWDGKGGGGGASAAGTNGSGTNGGAGGAGISSSITGSSVARGGGGAGGIGSGGTQGTATDGGGDAGSAGTVNTGGGGGGATISNTNSGAGGKGVVILSMLTADYTGTTSGSPTVIVDGSNTILVFNSDGSYTA